MGADTEGMWEAATPRFRIAPPTLLDRDLAHPIVDNRGLFVIHAVLLHTGKVLCFCGHAEDMYYAPVAYLYNPRDPATTLLRAVPMPARTDLFCCHFVQMADGRILIVGGSQQDNTAPGTDPDWVYRGSHGGKYIAVFDPVSETFSPPPLPQLAFGRWYPTAVLLGDGRTVVLSGRREQESFDSGNPYQIADAVEIISARGDRVSTLTNVGPPARLPIYPGVHLAPDGKLYTTHTNWGQEIPEPPGQRLTITGTQASWTALANPAPQMHHDMREEGMSVPLPATLPRTASQGRYLVVGGGRAMGRNFAHPPITGAMAALGGNGRAIYTGHHPSADTRSAAILDTTVDPPAWTVPVGPGLREPRVNGHCVLLPDATVAVMGGHNAYKWYASANASPADTHARTTPSLTVELYRHGHGFSPGAAMTFPRMYHAAALLLPDGRVWIAGGADPNEHEPWLDYPVGWNGRRYDDRTDAGPAPAPPPGPRKNNQAGAGAALNRKDYQIYRPPYLCKGLPQPVIAAVSPGMQVAYGATFRITTPQAASIRQVAIMRPGAVTHHTDTEQRYIELGFLAPAGNDIAATMVPASESNLVTPGYYMLWIIDEHGIPCANARFIHVVFPPPAPSPAQPPRRRSGPCIIATVALGSAAAPDVVFLRNARDDLARAGTTGRRFITLVSRCYEAFSPAVARWLRQRPRWRAATRDVLVRPGAACIRQAHAFAAWLPWPSVRTGTLIALLCVLGMVTLLAAPVVAAAIAIHAALGGNDG